MELGLRGTRAFISGSSQGIGFAIASALAAEGVDVVLNGRDERKLDAAVDRLRATHPEVAVSGLAADFTDPGQVADLTQRLGAVDILVNNVGLFGLADFADIADEDWTRYFEVNVMSGVRLSRALLPRMRERGWGRIVFVSSESGVNIPADMVHYGVTKAAMIALGNGVAKLTRGTGVTVNTVLGGPTYSEGVAASVAAVADARSVSVEAMKQAIIGQNATTLLERFLDPSEIADLVVYLASTRSSATNGAALRADGGVLTTVL
ncbi:SDR family NAD(P)-dependent oxidoreductase [Microbacterium sp. BLY]|uniref:SDR family NAD(P)-dependent oxidoreductase n=1 Tax=Microbacterium sp. BLY TaxID=2823280 RepID=UPI001B33BAA5|nr:SDR family oxidoreductase [Microbacterium sp. BLY]MBP3977408.1 SDR family oxidoreductase [Microbacterium sp. BLY]